MEDAVIAVLHYFITKFAVLDYMHWNHLGKIFLVEKLCVKTNSEKQM